MTEDIYAKTMHPLNVLGLSTRACNALKRTNIATIGDILRLGSDDIADIYQIGPKQYAEITDALSRYLATELYTFPPFSEDQFIQLQINGRIDFDPPIQNNDDTLPLAVLGLTTRSQRILSNHGINSVGQLRGLSRSDLKAMEGLGNSSIVDIEERWRLFNQSNQNQHTSDLKVNKAVPRF